MARMTAAEAEHPFLLDVEAHQPLPQRMPEDVQERFFGITLLHLAGRPPKRMHVNA